MAKEKQKTRKSAAKRFKVTASGKVLHRSQMIRHLRSNKSKRQVRRLLQMKEVKGTFKAKIKRMLGKK
ncbi:50S ribosomal protein L35 [Candidatus Roizmanbacteria bacterium RIFCSPLOWO2_01_FULL_38_12]|uniref:Large ribosomal subunit protein bL35 n=1 Tax=Candidatus Roizmanbacteria bacterium RIFCSPLOWO2_01_FULL_38_12 TaxID=1802061 RepID=A0A1F7IV08_9BACT|nr:MAG: 50S ribosomal protein L35 [Candidatus Roizmanbacteria bacterium RIFCSPHIGHO2_01_FULL_38_15]OGK35044.1 MAG: 50S ribosomal protein L35 [Candidatus Roizmanbacteria bacterium RIFCSPHIGHO2_12_FULL_38_13]OGK47199.1 MAG: 50S ribosomal protein L35 [Candidatus Roizmanbacteria bacterium RIFCSPLOWO2_01_FULL_38_12]